MRCPSCGHPESKVVDSRPSDDYSTIRRRRECLSCRHRFTTYERLGDSPLLVIKSDGSSETYDRAKLLRGVTVACAKRPITPDQINNLIDGLMMLRTYGLPACTKTSRTLRNSHLHWRI